jgi:hypothetical protein
MAGSSFELNNSVDPYQLDVEAFTYDGNNLLGKIETSQTIDEDPPVVVKTYQVRSSVLGGEVVSELNGAGTYVRANGTVIAITNMGGSTTGINYQHKDPALNTIRVTEYNGATGNGAYELSPDGQSLGTADPYTSGVPAAVPEMYNPEQNFSAMVNGQFQTFSVDGIQVTRGHFGRMVDQAFGGLFGLIEHKAGISHGEEDEWVPDNGGEGTDRDPIRMGTLYAGRSFSLYGWSPSLFQIPLPKLPPNANYTADQRYALNMAFWEALRRLRNPACKNLFENWLNTYVYGVAREDQDILGPVLDEDPSTVLKNITFRYLDLGLPTANASGQYSVAGAATPNRTNVFINTNGPFVNRTLSVNGRNITFDFGGRAASLTQSQLGALFLLHELGHAFGELEGTYHFFGPDASDPTRNHEHTEQVSNASFPELNPPAGADSHEPVP